jgi:hypothetical protein
MIELNKLHAFVDGELSDAERQEVESRLAECKASQAEVASIKGLKSALGSVSSMECNDVWANCQSRLDAIDRVTKSGNFITKYSWGFVTTVALIVVIGGGYARRAQAGSVDSSALAGIFSGSGQPSPEKATRNAQLDQLLKHADQKLSRVDLISVMSGNINGLPAQRYDLKDSHGRLSLIVLPQISSFEGMTPNADGNYFYGQIESNTNAVGWRVDGAALILVGPRDFAALENVARLNFLRPL